MSETFIDIDEKFKGIATYLFLIWLMCLSFRQISNLH